MMPQGILTFNLDSPWEENAFQIATKAMNYALAWRDLEEEIRQILKYSTPSKEESRVLEMVKDWMIAIENERELVRAL